MISVDNKGISLPGGIDVLSPDWLHFSAASVLPLSSAVLLVVHCIVCDCHDNTKTLHTSHYRCVLLFICLAGILP